MIFEPWNIIFPFVLVSHDFIRGQHITKINVDVEQVDLVHDFASLTDRLARDDDVVVVGGIAARCINTVTGADTADNERIDL